MPSIKMKKRRLLSLRFLTHHDLALYTNTKIILRIKRIIRGSGRTPS
jgi:hypothetical protein